MQHDHALIKKKFLTPFPGVLGDGGLRAKCKIFATMLLHFVDPFNFKTFDLLTPSQGSCGWGSAANIFA